MIGLQFYMLWVDMNTYLWKLEAKDFMFFLYLYICDSSAEAGSCRREREREKKPEILGEPRGLFLRWKRFVFVLDMFTVSTFQYTDYSWNAELLNVREILKRAREREKKSKKKERERERRKKAEEKSGMEKRRRRKWITVEKYILPENLKQLFSFAFLLDIFQ